MSRAVRSRLSPWIENLILSYDSQQRTSSSVRLKAHVIGVGEMSQSQAQSSDSPTGLLFLSDGVLQIPAVLTALAWEHLQDQEDRESFSSLLNTTVCIRDYRLQFHMAQEQTKCRFFLSVGELATTAAGPVKDNTPCCTTMFSVRQKICMTWRVLLHQEALDSQASQCGFDLSELLGEWHHDCVQAVLEDVKERLMIVCSRPMSLQHSTSYSASMLTQQDTSVATGWDVDRIRYKALKPFSIPIKYLLIPVKNALQLQTEGNVASKPTVLETDHSSTNDFPSTEDSMLNEDMITRMVDRPLSNPWDIFPPLCTASSSSDVSPEATPTFSLHNAGTVSKPDQFVTLLSTQLPVQSSKDSWQISEHRDEEEEDTQINRSPPSWHFDTHAPTVRTVSRMTPSSHSDGRPFSYTYQMSGQNLQDLSHFKVSESLLYWAVKYLLVPKQTDNQHTIL
uniref:Shelterin complex subunit TPP1/Est3 domain-containing protein n=1 Tax=Mola mola TaxID=94237 RepID=A0A3Q4AGF5_MOLML